MNVSVCLTESITSQARTVPSSFKTRGYLRTKQTEEKNMKLLSGITLLAVGGRNGLVILQWAECVVG